MMDMAAVRLAIEIQHVVPVHMAKCADFFACPIPPTRG
jgi:hypothetical protein